MPVAPTKYERFRARWINCDRCELCSQRRNVVLFKGAIPASILFVGEAPGESEDVLGKPFAGPAGKVLTGLLDRAGIPSDPAQGVVAFANIVCCIPRDERGSKVAQPPKEAIKACSQRLRETIELVNPRAIVWVGDLAAKYGPAAADGFEGIEFTKIIHPAAILRMGVAQQGLALQRTVVALSEVVEGWE